MKKYILGLLLLLCSNMVASELIVGATAVPHAEILEFAKPILEKKGIELKIIVFNDYILPNKALYSKDVDVNFFQHTVYLNQQVKDNPEYKFTVLGAVHIEPMGLYSKRYKNISLIQNGDTILFSNSVADRGRVLSLLAKAGLITLKAKVPVVNLDISDIVSNKKQLVFKNDVDPAMLPKAYLTDEVALLVINTNYALEANLNPIKDALFLEDSQSDYSNILVVRSGDETRAEIKELKAVLNSPEVQKFIEDKYQGAIVPVK